MVFISTDTDRNVMIMTLRSEVFFQFQNHYDTQIYVRSRKKGRKHIFCQGRGEGEGAKKIFLLPSCSENSFRS